MTKHTKQNKNKQTKEQTNKNKKSKLKSIQTYFTIDKYFFFPPSTSAKFFSIKTPDTEETIFLGKLISLFFIQYLDIFIFSLFFVFIIKSFSLLIS